MLERVRELIAHADSTPYSAEADTFRAKAQELMDKFLIEEWELAQETKDTSLLNPVRKDANIGWWMESGHRDTKQALFNMYAACARHCNVAMAPEKSHYEYSGETGLKMPVFGTEQDLSYLDMLFTSLMLQMGKEMKPQYDPNLSLGHNIYNARSVGMKYSDIAIWLGKPEWEVNGKPVDGGVMAREYKRHMRASDIFASPVVNPRTFQRNYAYGFSYRISERLREMRGEVRSDNSMALAIRDAADKAKSAMWDEFPDMNPAHQRNKKALSRRKDDRVWDPYAQAAGAQSADRAEILGNESKLSRQKEIE